MIFQVMIIDPTSPFSGPPLKLGETLLKHSTPVRVGLVLATGSDDPILEAAIRSAFNFVAQEKNSNKEAFYFLSQVCELVFFLTICLVFEYTVLMPATEKQFS